MALCGGCCACAICHVYIDEAFAAELPARSQGETDRLESSDGFTEASRLSCQIPVSDALDGLRLTVAPED